MANKPLDTRLLDRAIVYAVRAHAGTERRGKGFPYIVHPLEAVEIVATMTADQELLAAAALHDTVEDTDVTIEQIRAEFGDRVASFVAAESDEPHQRPDSVENWRARKQAAIARDYAVQGDALWNLFHAKDRKDHEWHYRGLADALNELRDTFAYKEFEQLINQVFDH